MLIYNLLYYDDYDGLPKIICKQFLVSLIKKTNYLYLINNLLQYDDNIVKNKQKFVCYLNKLKLMKYI